MKELIENIVIGENLNLSIELIDDEEERIIALSLCNKDLWNRINFNTAEFFKFTGKVEEALKNLKKHFKEANETKVG